PDGAPHGDASTDHHDVRAGQLDVEPPEQVEATVGGARQRGRLIQHQFPQVDGVEPVGVLGGVDPLEDGVLVQVPRERELHDVAGAGRVGVELVDDGLELGLGGVGGQVSPDRRDPHLLAVPVLHLDVGVAARVVAHEHGGQPRGDTPVAQRRDAGGEVGDDLVAGQFSVQLDRGHRGQYPTPPRSCRWRIARMAPMTGVGVRVLFDRPRIPPNTGNAIRMSAGAGCELHLAGPLGFDLSESELRRAGLAYHDLAHVEVHEDLESAYAALLPARVWAFTTHGELSLPEVSFAPGD